MIDGRTGEVSIQLINERKVKVFSELILKANRAVAEELGRRTSRRKSYRASWIALRAVPGHVEDVDRGCAGAGELLRVRRQGRPRERQPI